MSRAMHFTPCGPGVIPRFYADTFNRKFREWQEMCDWCDIQGWRMGKDYLANAEMGKPWYFRTKEQQMWFTLRWSS